MPRGWAVNSTGEYPDDWKNREIQRKLAERFNYHCEHCGAEVDKATGYTIGKPRRDGHEHVIAIHHIDGDKSNCEWTNLLYCCQACHLEVQSSWGPGDFVPLKWIERFNGVPRWMKLRGLPYKLHTQMKLF